MAAVSGRTANLTAYDFACGYVEVATNDANGTRISLYGDEHHVCYHVHHYRSGLRLAIGYINYTQSYQTLKEARRAYHTLCRSEQATPA